MALYIAFSFADFVVLSLTPNAIMSDQPANVDTYYIVGLSNAALSNAYPLAFFAAATWMLSRYGALIYPKTTVVLFWFLHISLLCANFLPNLIFKIFPHPRRYIDYPDFFAAINLVTAVSATLSFLAVVSLCGLLIWSSFNAWRRA
jgi:heme/copper-type cytochrome/quinol oxidase subunit 1